MVELISKVSKGSRMDQIYIPKNREDFGIGSYVIIRPLDSLEKEIKPFFHGIKHIEPVKMKIINEVLSIISNAISCENIIITGSFLERGFKFNDIDVIVVSENKVNIKSVKEILNNKIGAEFHIIVIGNGALSKGFSTDPLYKMMLTECVSKKRFIYKVKHELNYKILDLHLLKSRLLIDNSKILNGNEKYEMTRNLVAISLFIEKKEISKDKVDSAINEIFGNKAAESLKENIIKEDFLIKYKKFYKNVQNKILKGVKNESK